MKSTIFVSTIIVFVFLQSIPKNLLHTERFDFFSKRNISLNKQWHQNHETLAEAYLMILCDVDAKIIIDGELLGQVEANQFKRFTIIPGQHLILVETLDSKMRWEGQIYTPQNEQTLLKPKLLPSDPTVGIPSVFKDPIDQKEYKTIKIGNLEWFAENYTRDIQGNYAPNKTASEIPMYGRLYKYNGINTPPNGWRIPTEEDYKKLLSLYENQYEALVSGKSGFNVLFAGIVDIDKHVLGFNNLAAFWTSTPGPQIGDLGGKNHPSTKCLIFEKDKKKVGIYHVYQSKSFSVRFVRDI